MIFFAAGSATGPSFGMMELPRRDRYAGFQMDLRQVHPLKRMVRALSGCFRESARFIMFGLPACMDVSGVLPTLPVSSVHRGIATALGANLTTQGSYIAALTAGAGPYIESRFLTKQRCFPKIVRHPGTVISLVGDGDRNYFRWLMETLPRLRFLEEAGNHDLPIYACQKRAFHRESLRMLVGAKVEIVASEQVEFLRADELLVPRPIDENERWIIPWLRERILPRIELPVENSLPKRIYISRRKATGRKIANEAELVALLKEHGFVSVTLEDMAWLDQVALFQAAEMVVGPHGAGLANLIFCRPSTRVLEFIAKEYPFTFYPQISAQLGLNHDCIFSEPTDPGRIHASDLRAPLDRVHELLRN